MSPDCDFCNGSGGAILWQNDLCRVVRVEDADYPGFCRVILGRHVREMTELPDADRVRLMAVVFAVEEVMRATMRPDKVNLASLGNMTPHVHWHVIPRYREDRHFPGPVWAAPQREAVVPAERRARCAALAAALAARLGPSAGPAAGGAST
jgi:diadenosine tetraphosphate (Ap4A) HIT family hydrolase